MTMSSNTKQQASLKTVRIGRPMHMLRITSIHRSSKQWEFSWPLPLLFEWCLGQNLSMSQYTPKHWTRFRREHRKLVKKGQYHYLELPGAYWASQGITSKHDHRIKSYWGLLFVEKGGTAVGLNSNDELCIWKNCFKVIAAAYIVVK